MIIKLLAIIGLTLIVTDSYIFRGREKIRPEWLKALFSCSRCFGFWAGLMIYFNPFEFIDYAFAGSLLAYFAHLILKNFEKWQEK